MLILNYHRVGTPTRHHRFRGMFVSPAHLRFQVKFLQRAGYTFVTVATAWEEYARKSLPPRRLACITFDDGYEDNLRALPVLAALGVPATIYVITADVGKKNLVWSEAGEAHPANLLNWQQLRHLQEQGWEIGSHADQHVHLGRYSPEEQYRLIADSVTQLRQHLGAAPKTFAYPYGHYGPETPQIVKECGFIAAVTTQYGHNLPGTVKDPLQLKRIPGKGFRLYHYLKGYWLLRQFASY